MVIQRAVLESRRIRDIQPAVDRTDTVTADTVEGQKVLVLVLDTGPKLEKRRQADCSYTVGCFLYFSPHRTASSLWRNRGQISTLR